MAYIGYAVRRRRREFTVILLLLVSGRASRAHASAPNDVGVRSRKETREDVLGHRRVVLEVRRDPAGHRYQVELGEVLDGPAHVEMIFRAPAGATSSPQLRLLGGLRNSSLISTQ